MDLSRLYRDPRCYLDQMRTLLTATTFMPATKPALAMLCLSIENVFPGGHLDSSSLNRLPVFLEFL